MSQRTLTLLGDVVRCNFVITYVLEILGHERRPSERRGRHVTRLLSTCVPPLDGSKNLRAASISARKCIYKQYNQLEGLTFRAQSEARPASPLTHHRIAGRGSEVGPPTAVVKDTYQGTKSITVEQTTQDSRIRRTQWTQDGDAKFRNLVRLERARLL